MSFQVPPHNDIVDEAGTSLLLNLGKANSNKLLYKNFYLSDLHAYKYGIIFSLYNNAQNLRILFFTEKILVSIARKGTSQNTKSTVRIRMNIKGYLEMIMNRWMQ